MGASLIKRHLVTFFVPFLPLEREHVRQCIQRRLYQAFSVASGDKYKLNEKDIITRVLELIEFAPSEFVFSVSGCKKVQQKLDYVLESVRIKRKDNPQEL